MFSTSDLLSAPLRDAVARGAPAGGNEVIE